MEKVCVLEVGWDVDGERLGGRTVKKILGRARQQKEIMGDV